MHDDGIRVETGTLRRAAGELTGPAYRLGHGPGQVTGLVVDAPGWRTATALAQFEAAVHTSFGTLAARIADVAAALRQAADGYDAADDRAVRRMAGVR